ncbi:hypothetical protein MAPG_05174 [Magnaporthiopsis poae ATCC 64411]|uniref:Uncharacterized protein n=1 Tax=Magnaporthiopsis poae (strain ATCC 64411 / 73-15) TaxID=644358 RepID=A0A0C4DYP8_MAGP6|nr:hypothetical protein MAPG_05174 [Magnaporthiopsis poae ATCC 64411]
MVTRNEAMGIGRHGTGSAAYALECWGVNPPPTFILGQLEIVNRDKFWRLVPILAAGTLTAPEGYFMMICDVCHAALAEGISELFRVIPHHPAWRSFRNSVKLGCSLCNDLWLVIESSPQTTIRPVASVHGQSSLYNDWITKLRVIRQTPGAEESIGRFEMICWHGRQLLKRYALFDTHGNRFSLHICGQI